MMSPKDIKQLARIILAIIGSCAAILFVWWAFLHVL